MKLLKSHEFWVGLIVAFLLIGFFPQLNLVANFKKGQSAGG